MSDKTGIQWTDATWNPWYGCTKVSPGCAHCYMYRDQTRYGRDPDVVTRSKTTFGAPLKWREPRRVFTCSWSDFFHEAADSWRAEAWEIVRATPHLTYQVLTKRPENIAARLPDDWGDGYPNVWLGTSVENQRWIDRVTPLVRIPAAVHFVSAEPLLGPVSFRWGLWAPWKADRNDEYDGLRMLDWLIVGGESGPEHRPMDLEWARILIRQCRSAGVAVFVKQLGGWPDARGDMAAWPDDLRIREFPRVRA